MLSCCGVFPPLCLCVSFLLVHHISLLLPHTLPDMFNIFFPLLSLSLHGFLLLSSSFFFFFFLSTALSRWHFTLTLIPSSTYCVCVCSAILQCSSTVTQATIRYHSKNASCRKLKVLVFRRACVCVCFSVHIQEKLNLCV